MHWIDTHTHLHFADFDPDRDAVVKRAVAAGVQSLVNIGTSVEGTKAALGLAEKYPNFYATAGIHPHDAAEAKPSDFDEFKQLLQHEKVVAIGEVGLDFFRDLSPRHVQREVLLEFIRLHEETGKPLVIHSRDAYSDLVEIFTQAGKKPYRGIIHCFTGTETDMMPFLDLGFDISFAGVLTYKKNDALREACRKCPLERMHVETDAPYLAPQSLRGKRNEPAFMAETARLAAELKGVRLEDFAAQLAKNAERVLGIRCKD